MQPSTSIHAHTIHKHKQQNLLKIDAQELLAGRQSFTAASADRLRIDKNSHTNKNKTKKLLLR